MHVRIDSDVLISRRSEPGDDIIERNNRFDVYLKPQHADDAAIKRLSHFPGLPPVSILMPAHSICDDTGRDLPAKRTGRIAQFNPAAAHHSIRSGFIQPS